jgi:hypothetical protein
MYVYRGLHICLHAYSLIRTVIRTCFPHVEVIFMVNCAHTDAFNLSPGLSR